MWNDEAIWRDSIAAGDGTVTLGTMLLGTIRDLGVTEASPTAGITDYSRKDADDFGEGDDRPARLGKADGGQGAHSNRCG